jgi:hypothetical protein
MEDRPKLVIAKRAEHHVHMVWHDAPRMQCVTNAVEVLNCFDNDMRCARIGEERFPAPNIQVPVDVRILLI